MILFLVIATMTSIMINCSIFYIEKFLKNLSIKCSVLHKLKISCIQSIQLQEHIRHVNKEHMCHVTKEHICHVTNKH